MWLALEKLGVLGQTIQLNRSFHDDMRARVRLEGMMIEEIQVQNGPTSGLLHGTSLAQLVHLPGCREMTGESER